MTTKLDDVRSFLEGFEDDKTQEGIAELLATVDAIKAEHAELLAALKGLVGIQNVGESASDESVALIKASLAAIAKAEGQA